MRRFTWQESSDLLTEDLDEFLEEPAPERGSTMHKYWVGELLDLLHSHDERVNGYAEENQFPVLLTVTETKVAWIEGSNAKDTAERLADSGEEGEYWEHAEVACDSDIEAEQPDRYELQSYVYTTKLGPYLACRTCERPGPWEGIPRYQVTTHTDECPVLAEQRAQWDRDAQQYRLEREAKRAARVAEQQKAAAVELDRCMDDDRPVI